VARIADSRCNIVDVSALNFGAEAGFGGFGKKRKSSENRA
jgi:hypothetical protein